jgi:hypothetical protein
MRISRGIGERKVEAKLGRSAPGIVDEWRVWDEPPAFTDKTKLFSPFDLPRFSHPCRSEDLNVSANSFGVR